MPGTAAEEDQVGEVRLSRSVKVPNGASTSSRSPTATLVGQELGEQAVRDRP